MAKKIGFSRKPITRQTEPKTATGSGGAKKITPKTGMSSEPITRTDEIKAEQRMRRASERRKK